MCSRLPRPVTAGGARRDYCIVAGAVFRVGEASGTDACDDDEEEGITLDVGKLVRLLETLRPLLARDSFPVDIVRVFFQHILRCLPVGSGLVNAAV